MTPCGISGARVTRNETTLLRVESLGPYLAETEGMIRVEEQPMEDEAHQASIASILPERIPNVPLDRFVGLAKFGVERDLMHRLLIGGKIVCNVFQRDKRRRTHQELAEEQRGRTRLARDP